ncbi:peptidase E [Paenibacillus selenitireducens]|uniref:Peptidase E n=1 Tax=Paenibacillus selenitireducens TaxID=1324314 RepID=A0A1T2X1M9_9BACL|nr:Type 1 glutamine amidotransferase-like domain-containing protein [Paenibacillus selenitireducens]OPA73791.1 peptidase E [Paenibacillus selenitireducens]
MKQIIAMGGGGFSQEPENPLLDTYILQQSHSARPKVCFIPTASGDAEGYIQGFYKAFSAYDCVPSHLSLFQNTPKDLEDYLLDKDILYVGGGNTKNMLLLWKAWKVDQYIRKAWENDVVLAGLSAGSICWFQEGVTDSIPGELTRLECLGFLKGSSCPHYDEEVDRRSSYHRLLQEQKIGNGIAMDDGVAVHYQEDQIFKVISSRALAKAYQVSYVNQQVTETEITPIFLGN